MAKREFAYRGKTLEELQAMSLNDVAALLPSRQRRKVKRGFTDEEKKFAEKIKVKNNVKTHLRHMIVLPYMVGKTVRIHTGKEFQSITLQEDMIGYYLGELALTRKRIMHSAPGVGATKAASTGTGAASTVK